MFIDNMQRRCRGERWLRNLMFRLRNLDTGWKEVIVAGIEKKVDEEVMTMRVRA